MRVEAWIQAGRVTVRVRVMARGGCRRTGTGRLLGRRMGMSLQVLLRVQGERR